MDYLYYKLYHTGTIRIVIKHVIMSFHTKKLQFWIFVFFSVSIECRVTPESSPETTSCDYTEGQLAFFDVIVEPESAGEVPEYGSKLWFSLLTIHSMVSQTLRSPVMGLSTFNSKDSHLWIILLLWSEKRLSYHLVLENTYGNNLLSDISNEDYTKGNRGPTDLEALEGLEMFIDDIFV